MIACIWVFVVVQPSAGSALFDTSIDAEGEQLEFSLQYAAIPCELTQGRALTQGEVRAVFEAGVTEDCSSSPSGPPADPGKNIYLAAFYSMFMHGGWLHLAGNMLFLWIFGNNVEDRIGRLRFLLFYLASGLAALVGHVLVQPESALPVVGASGAIAGVMGAYLVLFPRAWVKTWVFLFVTEIPAALFLVGWFISQFFINPNSGVAWVAHVSGFAFGAIVGLFLRGTRSHRPDNESDYNLNYDGRSVE